MRTDAIVSIVVPTFNRLKRMARCIDKIARNVGCPHEVIVVDGGSTDGSREWLAERSEVKVILEPKREGAVRAFNRGFRAATGPYVMWLNDDAYPLPGAVEAALAMIRRADLTDLGMVAFYHSWDSEHNILDSVTHEGKRYALCHVRGYCYANFGLLRNELLERIGYADERYYFFGFDPDLALTLQLNEGLSVLGCPQALVHHDQHHDERKRSDVAQGQSDNDRLFEKWDLPERGSYPNPASAYQEMLAERINRRGSRTTHRRQTHQEPPGYHPDR